MHKYTSDGKKVVVVGKLNATETIVQEIFVKQDGSEIPSGEQFVTKSLHDEPVVTWHDKREREIKESLARLDKQLEDKTNRVRLESQKAAARMKSLAVFATKATRESFKLLEDFVAGRITHVVRDEYSTCEIKEFDKEIVRRDGYRGFEEDLRLLSLFGRSDGTLQWRIHEYCDISRGCHFIMLAHGLSDARVIVQGCFDAKAESWRTGKQTWAPDPKSYLDMDGTPMASLTVPEDVKKYHAEMKAANKAASIARLNAELEKVMRDE